jgi:hypothetical protein
VFDLADAKEMLTIPFLPDDKLHKGRKYVLYTHHGSLSDDPYSVNEWTSMFKITEIYHFSMRFGAYI